eukprot:2593707-Amphidinium_carterae.1
MVCSAAVLGAFARFNLRKCAQAPKQAVDASRSRRKIRFSTTQPCTEEISNNYNAPACTTDHRGCNART